jgi:hypothetical protein
VFALDQTDGEPLTEPPALVMPTGEGPAGAWDALAGLLGADGWSVEREAITGDTQGYTQWATRRVVVRPDLARTRSPSGLRTRSDVRRGSG